MFWCLKPGFRCIPNSNAQKFVRKVRPYKPCTSGASESEFHLSNRILHLKVGVLVYTVSRLSECQGKLSIAYSTLILWSLPGSLPCCKTDCTTSLPSDMQDVERGQLWCARSCTRKLLVFFNCNYVLVWSRFKIFVCIWLTPRDKPILHMRYLVKCHSSCFKCAFLIEQKDL